MILLELEVVGSNYEHMYVCMYTQLASYIKRYHNIIYRIAQNSGGRILWRIKCQIQLIFLIRLSIKNQCY